jgi:hypothetical protein
MDARASAHERTKSKLSSSGEHIQYFSLFLSDTKRNATQNYNTTQNVNVTFSELIFTKTLTFKTLSLA